MFNFIFYHFSKNDILIFFFFEIKYFFIIFIFHFFSLVQSKVKYT